MNHPTNESRVFSDISKAFNEGIKLGMKECYVNWKPIALKRITKILQKTIFMCTWKGSYS